MAKKVTDIKQTGPQSYRDLQKQNSEALSLSDDNPFINLKPSRPYTSTISNVYEGMEKSPLQQSGQSRYWGESQYDNPYANEAEYQPDVLQETRYENQPWYDTWLNGAGKMYGTAGTTFVSSLVGLPYGLFAAGKEGRWSALWDNDITQVLGNVDDWLEENMTNYRSRKQQESPWYDPSNLFSMNFIADDIIKNAGFTLGAAASMAVGSGTLGLLSKSLGFVNKISKGAQMANNVLGALFSATGEGMIEARQGVEERNKLELQKLDDALAPEANALALEEQQINEEYALTKGQGLVRGYDGRYVDPAYENYTQRMQDLNARKQELNQKYEAGRAQIKESGQEMGNKILLGNQVLLTVGNLIQFDKLLTRSFDAARHAAKISSKAVKPVLTGTSRAGKTLAEGYKVSSRIPGMVYAAGKGLVTEGSEEMNQQWIQSGAGASVNEEDVNDYWKAKLDPEAYREATKGLYTTGQAISKGFNESWGDLDQWEQFVVGGITGLAGSYSPTKLFNQDKKKKIYDPRRYGSWEGGAVNEIRDFNAEYNQYSENIDDLNRILAQNDFGSRVASMIGHTYTQGEKDIAAEEDDKKAWKDADDKQMIHDIQAFVRAGKLDDLRTIYDEVGSSLTDEDIESIVKRTTREVTAEEDKNQHDMQIDNQIAEKQREIQQYYADIENAYNESSDSDYIVSVVNEKNAAIESVQQEIANLQSEKDSYVGKKRYEGAYVDIDGNKRITDEQIKEIIKHNQEELNRRLESYLQSVDYVDKRTNGQLSKDQEDNLAYLHNLGKESTVRMQKIMADVRKNLPAKFLLKTTKTPEQLADENASSDLTFSKTDKTKDGYVEVDTSLMNDVAFADFFQREVIRGGNIDPEFAETADEKAAREEEEKNLPEAERKKKLRERASKKWQEAIQKKTDDAKEQWSTNWDNIVDGFMENYRSKGNVTFEEALDAFSGVAQDLKDASELYDQAGEFNRTLAQYMANPSLVNRDKKKAETTAEKAETEKQAKNKFAGKNAKQINEEIANGDLSVDDVDDFLSADLSDVSDEDVKAAQKEAKKSQEIRQKGASLKSHIQENLGDNPSNEEIAEAEMMMKAVDNAVLAAENPEDINISTPELNTPPAGEIDPNISPEDLDGVVSSMQEKMADAFNAYEESKNAQDDIPEELPSINDVETPEVTGDDETVTVPADVVAPDKTSPKKEEIPVPKNPLTEAALSNIESATRKLYEKPNDTGTWRSTTTRYKYHSSTDTYHDGIANKESKEYKRSKAIHDYLSSQGAFDRMDDSTATRIKPKDTIHFMVKYLPEVFGKNLEELSDEEKPYAMVIIMMDDKGEVLGDLPLAQLEPTYRSGHPNNQVQQLLKLQEKVFDAFYKYHNDNGGNEAIVDSTLTKEGIGNLNLTFDNAKKSALVTRVKQVMRGVVPYINNERNTLNEVAGSSSFELGVRVTSGNIALRRGDKALHRNIAVPDAGSAGQPYIMLPTPSGEKIAVPFYMQKFQAAIHKDTELYKQLCNAVYGLMIADPRDLKAVEKNKDVIKGLLQVEEQENKRIVEIQGNNVNLHLQSLTNPDSKIEISITKTDNLAEDAKTLVAGLSGISINVSLQYLNEKISTGVEGQQRVADYNRVIGEIADVNLPKGTTHTVNGWFTVDIVTEEGLQPSKAVTPKQKAKEITPATAEEKKVVEPVNINREAKSLEDIEKEMQAAKVINRQTKESWAAIPNDLKLKLVNEGAPLQFSYNGKKVTVGLSNMSELVKVLKEADIAAKSGKLNVYEAAKPMEKNAEVAQRENEREARRWLAKNLPSLSSEERTQFVDRLSRMGNDANKYWGSYRGGVIQIQRNAPMGTVYHEAFHYVMDMVLSPEEKSAIIDAAKKEYGTDLSYWEAEERLAEDFRRYSLDENATGIVGTIKKWFRKLKDKIMRYNRISDVTINQLFWKINNGELAQKSMQAESFEENQQNVLREIRNVQKEKYSWNNLSAETRANLESSGLSQAAYEQQSLEIQEQYVKCRG